MPATITPLRLAVAAAAFSPFALAQGTLVPPSTGAPAARNGAALAPMPQPGPTGLLLFGGTNPGGALADTWRWTGADWLPQASAMAPSPRHGHAMATAGGELLLFGGATGPGPGTPNGELWRFTAAGGWQQLNVSNAPPPRLGHVMVADAQQRVILFGGLGASGRLDDTWVLDPAPARQWHQLLPASRPAPRAAAAACFDRARGQLILFGGDGASGPLGDTWLFDGAGWQQQQTAAAPAPRAGAGMLFDPERQAAMLTGGSPPGPYGDTWEWNGARWIERTSVPHPPPLGPTLLAFDAARAEQVVVANAAGQSLQVLASASAVAAFASDIGRPCRDPGHRLSLRSLPRLGSNLAADLGTANAAFVVLGFSRFHTRTGPLPQPMPLPHLATCLQLVDVLTIDFTAWNQWGAPVPTLPSLLGLRFCLQAVPVDLLNAQLIDVSNGLECQFGGPSGTVIVEPFDSAAMLDRSASAGDWQNGFGSFGALGGDGRHGAFDPTFGTFLGNLGGKDTWLFDTSGTTIPGSATLDGQPATVTDGRFFFSEMLVPANVRLRFQGRAPVRISVRGRLQVDGEIDVGGESLPYYATTPTTSSGQPGGVGGPFAGGGGHGGDRCAGSGAMPNCNGGDGGDASVVAAHAYTGSTAGSGGRGSSLFPQSGLNSSLVFGTGTIQYVMQAAAGGGGGGFATAGGNGQALSNNHNDPVLGVPPRLSFLGPMAPGGTAVQLLPLPPLAHSSLHFLVGGAGGGGAGSHALFQNNFILASQPGQAWVAGGGGGGGGGAMALQAGDQLLLAATAALLARGGSTGDNVSTVASGQPQPAPGGAGSGGSIVLQSGSGASVLGSIDVRGGHGGQLDRQTVTPPPAGGRVQLAGGDGAPGFVRFELPSAPTPAMLPNAQPAATAANVGPLVEQSERTGFQSRFFVTGLAAPPYLRYELDAVVGGAPVRYSDDPRHGLPARFGTAPIEIWFQGGALDPVTGQPLPGTLTPWRPMLRGGSGPSLQQDASPAFRFLIVLDRTLAADVRIDRLAVLIAD